MGTKLLILLNLSAILIQINVINVAWRPILHVLYYLKISLKFFTLENFSPKKIFLKIIRIKKVYYANKSLKKSEKFTSNMS